MQRRDKRKTKIPRPKNLLDNDQVLTSFRESIRRTESLELDKPDRFYSWNKKYMYALMILASTALEHLSLEQRRDAVVEEQKIQQRIGVAMFEKRKIIERCLCKKHDECMGRYASSYVKDDVICRCPCHGQAGTELI